MDNLDFLDNISTVSTRSELTSEIQNAVHNATMGDTTIVEASKDNEKLPPPESGSGGEETGWQPYNKSYEGWG